MLYLAAQLSSSHPGMETQEVPRSFLEVNTLHGVPAQLGCSVPSASLSPGLVKDRSLHPWPCWVRGKRHLKGPLQGLCAIQEGESPQLAWADVANRVLNHAPPHL